MTRDTIALVSTYSHPSRDSVEATLRAAFPEFRLENISVQEMIRQHREWILPNLFFVAREFGKHILSRRKSFRESYFQTTYLLRRIHEAMRKRIDPARHVFSFQTQSMYDTSVVGVPHFIYTDHTHLSNLASPYFDRRMLRSTEWIALEKTIYENAACVFTRSTDVTADLVQRYGIAPGKIACVHAGSNAPVDADFRIDNDGYANRNILFVGGDWVRKGGPDLAQAFRQVLQSYPDAHLTIAGASPDLDLPNCTILGNVSLRELTHHYARASVFCLPTRLEPFGIAFLEAMQHRLPVVATATGAVPDMVREGITGVLVPPGDVGRLAEALTSLLGDPARCRQYGNAGYDHVVANYTWEKVGERMRDRILRTLDKSTP